MSSSVRWLCMEADESRQQQCLQTVQTVYSQLFRSERDKHFGRTTTTPNRARHDIQP